MTTWRTFIRHYPYHSLAAQVLGYVGEISATELPSRVKQGYRAGDEIGQSGVESSYDTYLRGVAGSARMHIDALGRPRSSLETTTIAKAGNDVRLTLDLKLQQAAEKALRTASISRSRTSSGTRAAARSSRSIRRTARSSRWRRHRATTHPSSPAT